MAELSKKLGEMSYDGLITDVKPFIEVGGGVIAAGAASYKRGTVMAKANGKLVPLASGGTPFGILCDDIDVTADEDENVAVYTAGCFDPDRVTVADDYTMTDNDIDQLRMRNIVFKAAQKM